MRSCAGPSGPAVFLEVTLRMRRFFSLDAPGAWRVPLLVGLVLRLLWAVWVPVQPVSDSMMYWEFAQRLAQGLGYSYPDGSLTAYWPVGTSAFYAVGMLLMGATASMVVGMNLLVHALSMWALWAWAQQLKLSNRAATLVLWWVALWPLGIQFTTVVASELLFNALWISALVVWPAAARQTQWWRWIGASVLLVGAIYVRPTAMPMLLALPALAFWQHRRWLLAGGQLLVVVSTALLLISPWAIRNHTAMGAYVPVSTNFGPNFWMGNNPATDGGFMWLLDREFPNEVARDKFYRADAVRYIREEPVQFVWNVVRRAGHTFSRENIGVHWNLPALQARLGDRGLTLLKLASSAHWYALCVLGVLGLARWIWSERERVHEPAFAAFWFTFLLFLAVPLATVGMDRYHLALNPMLMIGAAYVMTTRRPNVAPSGARS